MENSKSNHRGQAAPAPGHLRPLPPPPPSPCDDDDDDGICSLNDINHQNHHHHHQNVARYLRADWLVTRPETLIAEHGIEAVHKAAIAMWDAEHDGKLGPIRSRGGFAVYMIRKVATELQAQRTLDQTMQRQNLRVVGESQENTS